MLSFWVSFSVLQLCFHGFLWSILRYNPQILYLAFYGQINLDKHDFANKFHLCSIYEWLTVVMNFN